MSTTMPNGDSTFSGSPPQSHTQSSHRCLLYHPSPTLNYTRKWQPSPLPIPNASTISSKQPAHPLSPLTTVTYQRFQSDDPPAPPEQCASTQPLRCASGARDLPAYPSCRTADCQPPRFAHRLRHRTRTRASGWNGWCGNACADRADGGKSYWGICCIRSYRLRGHVRCGSHRW
jgi:hypothetical protein